MASNRYGYMAKIGIDTTGVQNGLNEADSAMRAFSREMREVNNVIAQGGNSAEMAAQRNQLYTDQITQLNRRLEALRSVEEDINRARANHDIDEDEYRAYRREIEQTENSLRNLREQQRDIGANAGRDYDKVISALKNVEKVALATTGAVAAALGKLSSDALAAYSQYEQLVGGIETLFAGAEDIVLKNAENAFKTAGISANNYMQTVTGFSATLLQGLEGDTKKAAEIADQALIDMADNANKMGTAMGSIQYAYQGFAKQNYTMLDNLKLGYGGSQAEMARLINDSGVLNGEIIATAENVKQIPFDKIIEAIHVIQTNLGITGTTALEAETTLEGSMNKLKASWENALVDIARPIDEFAQGGLTILNDNIDTIKEALVQMMEKIKPLLDDTLVKLQAWIDSGGVEKLADGFVDLVTFIINHKDVILGVFAALELALGYDRITKAVKGIKDLKDAITGVAAAANTAAGGIEAFGIGLSGWILVAGAAALAAAEVASGLNSIADAMTRVNMETKKSDDNVKNMSDRWNALSEMTGLDRYKEASAMLDDVMASEEEWSERYKKTVDELNPLQEKLFKTADETARMKELQKQKESLDAEYATLQMYHTLLTNEIDKYDDKTLANLERAAETQAKAQANAGKTNEQAVADAWEKIRETTKAEMDKYDDELATHKIGEKEYFAKRKAYLEAHRDEESKEWWAYYDKVNEYYDKLSKEEKAAADKEADEAAKAIKEAQNKKKEDTAKAWAAAEREQQEKGFDDEWLLNEYQKILDTLEKGSDLYLEYYDKWLKLRNDIQNEDIKEWENSSKKTADSIKKAYEDVNKAQEQAKKDYLKTTLALGEQVTGKGGKERFVLNDLDKESEKLQKYRESMDKLKATGISDDLLNGVMQFDYKDGSRQQFINELLGMSDKQREQYYKDYAEYMQEVEKTGAYDVKDKLEEANLMAAQGVNDIYANMPDAAYEQGKATADSYIQGIIDSMSGYDPLISGGFTDILNGSVNTASSGNSEKLYSGNTVINFVVDGTKLVSKTIDEIAQSVRRGGNPLNV